MAYVTVHYGPYESFGVVRHRTQRLRGLKERLESAGHTVELIPSQHWDRCVVEIARRNVFRCRLTNLQYYTDGLDDPVCARAMQAVEDAVERIRPEFLYPNIPLFSEEFFEETINEAFRSLNVREYIDVCFHEAVRASTIEEVMDVLLEETMRGEHLLELVEEIVEGALTKDYMQDLLDTQLQRRFSTHDYIAEEILNAVETRDYIKDTIIGALQRTHPEIKRYIREFVDTAVVKVMAVVKRREEGDTIQFIKMMLLEQIAEMPHMNVRDILDEMVEEVSRGRTASLSSTSVSKHSSDSYVSSKGAEDESYSSYSS